MDEFYKSNTRSDRKGYDYGGLNHNIVYVSHIFRDKLYLYAFSDKHILEETIYHLRYLISFI